MSILKPQQRFISFRSPCTHEASAGILLSGVTSAQRGWSRTRVTATLIYKRCRGPRSTEQEIFDAQYTHDSHRTLRNAFVVITFILVSQWKKGEKGTQKVTTKNANHRQLLVNVTVFFFLVCIQIITNGHLCPFLPPWMIHRRTLQIPSLSLRFVSILKKKF